MREELQDKKGRDYYTAWDNLMRKIEEEVLAFYTDLRQWADDTQQEHGLYGATCQKFDLPIKTFTQWLERKHLAANGLYDAFISQHRAEETYQRGVKLLGCRERGAAYADLIAGEEQIRLDEVKRKRNEWRDKNFPLIENAHDKNGAVIRPGDKVKIEYYGKPIEVRVKEIRIRNGKRVMALDERLVVVIDDKEEFYPAIAAERLDVWFGE